MPWLLFPNLYAPVFESKVFDIFFYRCDANFVIIMLSRFALECYVRYGPHDEWMVLTTTTHFSERALELKAKV